MKILNLDNPNYIRVNPDKYGNPRYIIHFTMFLLYSEFRLTEPEAIVLAQERAQKIGFRPCRNKVFSKYLVGQSYNLDLTIRSIRELTS